MTVENEQRECTLKFPTMVIVSFRLITSLPFGRLLFMNILFDLGNVVVDWNTEKVVSSLSLTKEKKLVIKNKLFGHSVWWDLDEGLKTESEVAQHLVETTELTFAEVENTFLAAKESLTDIPATIKLMEEFHIAGVKMFALSNMSVETYKFIKNRSFFDYFEDVVISGFIKITKPSPEIFEYTLNKFGLLPRDLFFVDDSFRNVTAAEQLGIESIHFKRTPECYAKIRSAGSN